MPVPASPALSAAITPAIIDIRRYADEHGLHVIPVWGGVDRPDCFGWTLNDTPSHRKLADRLERAIRAGAAFGPASIARDIDGKTYVDAGAKVIGRYMNADLQSLGF